MIPVRINVKQGDSRAKKLNLHLLGMPRKDNRTTRNESIFKKKKEKNIFLIQTNSSAQSTRVHVIFIGKGNENSYENRNLQILMEFLKINNKGRLLKHLGNSKSVYN